MPLQPLRHRWTLTLGTTVLVSMIFALALGRAYNAMIDAKSDSARQQAETIATVIAANRSLGSGILPPHPATPPQPPQMSDTQGFDPDIFGPSMVIIPFDSSTPAERVAPILRRLVDQRHTRARVYSREGVLLVDTAGASRGRIEIARNNPAPQSEGWIADFSSAWTTILCWILRGEAPAQRRTGANDDTAPHEVQAVMRGTGRSPKLALENSKLMIWAATPIRHKETVEGVVLLSTPIDF